MAKTIAFINEKGGVGKSSICFNTAWCFAVEQGKRTLMIDMDGQRANLTFFAGIDKTPGLATMYDVLTGDLDVKQSVLMVEDDLHIIPATADVSGLDNKNAHPKDMQRIINELGPYYDYIFIDVSPTPNRSHALALSAADYVVVPMLPDITSLEANMGIIESVRLTQGTFNPELKVLGIVFNKHIWRPLLSRQVEAAAKEMAGAMETKVFRTKIRQAVAMSENIGQNIGITSYAPKSKAADDIRNLCYEINEEVN